MDAKSFVEVVHQVVARSSANVIMKSLVQPPGKRPSGREIARSKWFNSLNSYEQELLKDIVNDSTDQAVFGFLCVLDGVRAIEAGKKGTLILTYVSSEGNKVDLNKEQLLHELYP
jgi:hypothetical protein